MPKIELPALSNWLRLDQNWMTHWWGAKVVFAHELGHVWDINSGFSHSGEMNRDLGGSSWCFFCSPNGAPEWDPLYHPVKGGDAYGNGSRNEYFAEGFAATIYNPLNVSVPAGVTPWINSQMIIDTMNFISPGAML